jgi:mono/diheme cytochrome c family protein
MGVLTLLAWVPVGAAEIPPFDFARYREGRFLYERHCVVCHGARGDGAGEMAASLYPRPRSFREGLFKFRTTPFGFLPTDDDLRHTIRYGFSGTGMGMFAQLTEGELDALLVYVKSFSRRWRQAEDYAEPIALPDPPGWLGDPARAANGKALYDLHCAACHGPAADGRGPAAAGLRDFWEQPVKPSDLRQPHLRGGDRPLDLYRVLTTGLNGTPMLSFDATLTPEQRWEIIAWVFTQKLPDVPTLGGAPPRDYGPRVRP